MFYDLPLKFDCFVIRCHIVSYILEGAPKAVVCVLSTGMQQRKADVAPDVAGKEGIMCHCAL